MSEVFANLKFPNGRSQELRPDNTRLYRHLGKWATIDHIFVVCDPEEGPENPNNESEGSFIWAEYPPNNQIYIQLAQLAIANECEMHLNIIKPNKFDIETFERHVSRDLEDGVPADWIK